MYNPNANVPRRLPRLTVIDNHGATVLEAVELVPYTYHDRAAAAPCLRAVGTVVGGGVTSRLFTATTHRPHKTGVVREIPLGGRHVHQRGDGQWYVDLRFC